MTVELLAQLGEELKDIERGRRASIDRAQMKIIENQPNKVYYQQVLRLMVLIGWYFGAVS